MAHLFHVTSVLNRESILAHGLDWTRMGAAPGIAGSSLPEEDGVFLCRDDFEAGFFVQMNNTGGPVEVWAVADIEEEQLITSGSGFCYFPARIPRSQVTLADWPAQEPAPAARRRQHKNKQREKKPRAGKLTRRAARCFPGPQADAAKACGTTTGLSLNRRGGPADWQAWRERPDRPATCFYRPAGC